MSRSKFDTKYVLIINSLVSSIGFNYIINVHNESKIVSEYTIRQGKNYLFKGFTLKIFSIFHYDNSSARQGYHLPQLLTLSLSNMFLINPAIFLCEQLSDPLITFLENMLEALSSFRTIPDLDCALFIHCCFELLTNILTRYSDL